MLFDNGEATALPAGLSPREVTELFLADFKRWNDGAYTSSDEALDSQTQSYQRGIIGKYCRPGRTHQPIAFSSTADHSPQQEAVVEESIHADAAVVRTRFTVNAEYNIGHDYAYHFTKTPTGWVLEELYLVDADGKTPCL